ncbi:hypothetical protein DFS34DRAFT_323851 [Phlyctochytrium arcticum]|nr:hypothetical protein DFS34DRAFT_323851 [Phlyctochytrium arcticum]
MSVSDPPPLQSDLTSYRPLPSDILELSEAETACHYCGISYLLLHKYERMREHVKGMENELSDLKNYVAERPKILAQIEKFKLDKLEDSATQKRLEQELQIARQTSEKTLKDLEDSRKKNEEQALQTTGFLQDQKQERENHRRKVNGLVQSLTEIRAQLLDQRQQVNSVKVQVRQSITDMLHTVLPTIQTQLETQLHSIVKASGAKVEKSLLLKAQGEMGVLRKELESMRATLQECKERAERSEQELRLQQLESAEHITAQKGYAQGLQGTCLKLEDKLHSAYTHIQGVEHERDHLATRLQDLEKRLANEKTYYQKDVSEVEKRVQILEGRLSLKEKELRELQEKHEEERRIGSQGGPALAMANRALAQKDEQNMAMERTIRELHSAMQALRTERQSTIEAHQSRIKQLQEKFLVDIREAGRTESEKREVELRREFATTKDNALRHLRELLTKEMDASREKYMREIDTLRKAKEDAELRAIRQTTIISRDWENKYAIVNDQLAKLKASNAADFAHYQARIRALEEQVAEASTRPTSRPNSDPVELGELKSQLKKREAEIGFLKETVRIECEERMELLAKLDLVNRGASPATAAGLMDHHTQRSSLQQSSSVQHMPPIRPGSAASRTSLTHAQSVPMLPPAREASSFQQSHHSPSGTPAPTNDDVPNDPAARNFYMMMRAAAAKKEKTLAARSSADQRRAGNQVPVRDTSIARGGQLRSSWSVGMNGLGGAGNRRR